MGKTKAQRAHREKKGERVRVKKRGLRLSTYEVLPLTKNVTHVICNLKDYILEK